VAPGLVLNAQRTAAPPAAAPTPAPLPLAVDAVEAARLCGIGRSLWLGLHSAGRVPAPIRLGRRVLWRREELAAWIEAGCPGRARWEAMTEARRRR
jgi:predicted DNA-binding transcriptional regulator AlpA